MFFLVLPQVSVDSIYRKGSYLVAGPLSDKLNLGVHDKSINREVLEGGFCC